MHKNEMIVTWIMAIVMMVLVLARLLVKAWL
jgi:hypothetical protein